jgi:DUF4097 and DUF4098 domain-containing protein YvlB
MKTLKYVLPASLAALVVLAIPLLRAASVVYRPGRLLGALAMLALPSAEAAALDDTAEKSFLVAPGGKLVINADRGSIDLTTAETTNLEVKVFRQVDRVSQARAEEILANHSVTFEQKAEVVTITGREKRRLTGFFNRDSGNLRVRWQVALPKNFSLDARTSGEDIRLGPELDGRATVQTSSGSIDIKTVHGSVEARNSGGNIKVERAGSDLLAQTSSGSIHLGRVAGSVEAHDSGGDISMNSVGDAVLAETSSGSIKIKFARGNVVAKDSGGDIKVEQAGGGVEARTSSGTITLGIVRGEIKAKNSGGDVVIGEVQGAVEVSTSSGTILITKLVGTAGLKNSGGRIEVKEASGAVLGDTSRGPFGVGWAGQPAGETRLNTSGGDIKVRLKESIGLNLEAKANGGRVACDMPILIQSGQREDHLEGKINGGGPLLRLEASGGSIALRRL